VDQSELGRAVKAYEKVDLTSDSEDENQLLKAERENSRDGNNLPTLESAVAKH